MVSKTTAGLLRDDGSVESLALGMGYVGDSEDGLDMMQCDWLIKHGEAIATALERGAAAEKALATQRALDDASGFEDEYVLESMRYRKVDALAAYDTLIE